MAGYDPRFIDADSIDDDKILLKSNGPLRSRNNADSADIEVLKTDASDDIIMASKPKVGAATALFTDDSTTNLPEGTNLYHTVARAKAAAVSDAVYGVGWDGVLDVAPSKNSVYDQMESRALDADVIKKDGSVAFTSAQSMGSSKLTSLSDGTAASDAVNKGQLDSAIAASGSSAEWQESALAYVADNTAVPASEVSGDRYILSADGGTPHANYDGAIAGSVVEYDGALWQESVPTVGTFISDDSNDAVLYYWGGAAWTQKAFEATTASLGLTKSGLDIRLDSSAAGDGLALTTGALSVNVDDSSIETNADSLRVKALGITDGMLAGSISDGKMASDYIQTSEVDDSSIEFGASLNVKALGIATSMLAATSVTAAKLGSDVAGTGMTGGNGVALAVDFGVSGAKAIQASDLASIANAKGASLIGVEDAAAKFAGATVEAVLLELKNDIDASTGTSQGHEIKTLSAGDITSGYVELAQPAISESIMLTPVGAPLQERGVDFTISVPVTNSRITWAGDLATKVEAGMKLQFYYEY